ncbi:MAG TPA: DUF58 domain-containing protein [Mycobacteriales bacterium]|nr:DUF58 domain-containing protein [Mycobacteriales bacterium]
MALTGRAAAAAALGIAFVFVAPQHGLTVVAVAVLLAVAVGYDLALAASPFAVRLERSGAASGRLGEPGDVVLVLTNAGASRLRGLVRDAWPPSTQSTPHAWRVDLAAGASVRLTTTLRPTRKGERSAAGVTIRAVGPLGLAARQRTRAAPWTYRVLPAFTSRRLLPEKLARLRELDGTVVVLTRGQGSEFDSLRGYVDGDDSRSIDWRATARRQEVVVRTWRPERDRQVVIVLDTGRTSAGRIEGATRFDSSLDAALLLAALARAAGDRVGLLAHDRGPRAVVPTTRQGEVLPAIMRATTDLEPVLAETDVPAIIAQLMRQSRRRSLIVWFTALEPAAMQAGLLPALPGLLRRHTLLLAAVSDPRLDELAADRRTVDATYRAAAAERARADRAALASTLRRRGVLVVTAPPSSFASKVADGYLDLKAAGRL